MKYAAKAVALGVLMILCFLSVVVVVVEAGVEVYRRSNKMK